MWPPSSAHGGLGCVRMAVMMADADCAGIVGWGGQQATDNGKMHWRCLWASAKAHLDPDGGSGGDSWETQLWRMN